MAFGKLLVIVAVVATVGSYQYEIEETKEKKAVAAEKDQTRSASPGREKGSFQKLSNLMNRTDDRKHNRREKGAGLKQIYDMKARENRNNDMLNDNEGAFAVAQRTAPGNDTDDNSVLHELRGHNRALPRYEATNKYNTVPLGTGVFCDFEGRPNASFIDRCMWEWNITLSSHGLGFKVLTAADVLRLNTSMRAMRFSGPTDDADYNAEGHFLYLAVDPTMESMVIKSPPFGSLREFCKFEAYLHQSKMQNASIKLVAESTETGMQWVLQEVTGNNAEKWSSMVVTIGRTHQEMRIIFEITRPNHISLTQPLPHIAIDNIRMVECLPELPAFSGGPCLTGQMKCKIMKRESCIKISQVCDLVKDCDDATDETQVCDKMPFGSYCNFEADACGFENVPQPILKWTRHFGPTPTDKTGPNFDHTCGPPDSYPPLALPPLTPARLNQTLTQCVGYYFFVNMNVTGPNNETAGFASTAVMKTVVFNPPPKVHGNITSKYYNCCMIRFYYQQNGRNYGSLSVDLVELTSRANVTTSLWFQTKNKGENWYRAAIFLPNVTRRYYLEFKTRMGMRIYSDSAIDDFSMAPECFGLNIDPEELGDYNYYDPVFEEKTTPHQAFVDKPYYRFTTCGATGRFGPSQAMCDIAYNNTGVTVTVKSHKTSQGIQVWEVPAEGLYTIIATGASGGFGSAWTGVSHGAQVRGLFELHKGEKLYMMIGQQGTNACKKTLSGQEGAGCAAPRLDDSQQFTSKTHEVRNTDVPDGGGGGGGGTFVYTMEKEGSARPLLVAGGGGGLSVGVFRDDGSQHARAHSNDTPRTGHVHGPPARAPGAGGGWVVGAGAPAAALQFAVGAAARAGGVGGVACAGAAHGGFGGGGGGCRRGGGGGGWIGGSTSDESQLHGGGGWSRWGGVPGFEGGGLAPRTGPGEVRIVPAIHSPQLCGCEYRCVAINEYRSEVKCYCPGPWTTDAGNHTKCILEGPWIKIPWVLTLGLAVTVVIFVIVTVSVCLYLYNVYQRKKEDELRQKTALEQELQLHRLRAAPAGANLAFNPHYGGENILPPGMDIRGLPKVYRDRLKLIKPLGQGAFGEVYQGLYRSRGTDSEIPVAVKTLPELSTGQAETEFLMEAAIMAKFNHTNVVHLIGVSFDTHPRFIVLELLAGGDLKNFLRESRPKPERASALTMKDLLLCSIDVCRGCRYLETMRFIHRDIAARNCLLTSRGPGRVVKIADFGMARDIYRADYYRKGGKVMLPIKWMPPEAYIDGVFTSKTDVWSFAVLMWEVFSLGMMPYTGCSNREVMEMVSSGGRLGKPRGCPQDIYRLMCECWNPEPEGRPAFAHIFDILQNFLQDPEIVAAPLPVMRSLLHSMGVQPNMPKTAPADYLEPTPPPPPPLTHSSTDAPAPHSKSPTAAQKAGEDLQYPTLLKASQDYGNIPARGPAPPAPPAPPADATSGTKFLQSNSTDRLLSSLDRASPSASVTSDDDVTAETSFCVRPAAPGPRVDKLISITPTSPNPPDNALSKVIKSNSIDKPGKNSLMVEYKPAPIASPDPPRINAWTHDSPKPNPKPLCLDAAQLEQNLNALKKNSGSVNLNTMKILPPYINVVTPNKLSESKTIQIDPKKAVIHDLQSPKENEQNEEKTLNKSHSAASLLNGPMTDVPYADSDNASSSSGGKTNVINGKNKKNYTEVVIEKKTLKKQGSNGECIGDTAEISC